MAGASGSREVIEVKNTNTEGDETMTTQSTNKRAVLAALFALVLALLLALSAGAALGGTTVFAGGPCEGTGQDDQIFGSEGPDVILARAGDDTVEGGGGDDEFSGGRGNDTINAGEGKDQVRSGRGSDRLFTAGDGEADTLNCGAGFDEFDADSVDEAVNCEQRIMR
jgi:Ca2+-binding RTX toxin-like protein